MSTDCFDAVVFDFDGTLVNPTIDFKRMREEVIAIARSYGVEEPSMFELHVWELVNEASSLLAARGGRGDELRTDAHEAILSIECEAARSASPLPGVKEMLSRLHARGVRVGVVTRNSREAVRIAFEGIENVCDVFLPRDAVEHVKPHPLHLETCLSLLRVEPSRSLMVGDHPIDISSGRVLGMRTAGVLTGSGSEGALRMAGADFIFRDATGILSLFGYPSSNGGSE